MINRGILLLRSVVTYLSNSIICLCALSAYFFATTGSILRIKIYTCMNSKRFVLPRPTILLTAVILAALVFQYSRVLSQKPDAETVHIASPTASSLGKFIDMPVSYHTGTPEVSIPIYIVREGP